MPCVLGLSMIDCTLVCHMTVTRLALTAACLSPGAQTLSWKHVFCFPIIGSISLLIFFFYFDFLQYFFSLSTAGAYVSRPCAHHLA